MRPAESDVERADTEVTPPLDRFVLGAELGAGGMGRVVRAIDTTTREAVAVKLVQNVEAAPGERNEVALRFGREVRAAASLRHPNICRVVAWGRAPQMLYMAMEIIDGPSVQDLHKAAVRRPRKRLPLPLSVEIVRQLCLALDHAHEHGVIHRDIKPANLMLTTSGLVKLVDFGIARSFQDEAITQTGAIVGTPSYMSPEQVLGGTVDGRTDQFAAGTALFTLVSGRMRFAGMEPTSVLMKVAREPMPTLFESARAASPALARTLARATRLSSDQRFASCAELGRALEQSDEWSVFADDNEARDALARYLVDPDVVGDDLERRLRDRHVDRARRLNDINAIEAAKLASVTAAHLAGQDPAEPADTPLITDALAAFAATPTAPGVLKRLADLYRANGHVRLSAAYLLRYLQERPQDSHASLQLNTLIDGPPSNNGRLSTRDIVAGVRTGGAVGVVAPARPSTTNPETAAWSPPKPAPPAAATSSVSTSPKPAPTPKRTDRAPQVSTLIVEGAPSDSLQPRTALIYGAVAVVVAGLGFAAFSRFVKSSVDDVQVAISDNQQAVGRFEANNAERRWESLLSQARGQSERGHHAGVVTAVNQLIGEHPPATLALEGMLLRASAREHLSDDVSARLDYEAFLRESEVNDVRRPEVRRRLDALYARLPAAPTTNPTAPMPPALPPPTTEWPTEPPPAPTPLPP